MTAELVFYTHPMSRGRIVRWMLEELGQPYRTELIPYGPAMKSPEYRAINPMGKVPALRHGDTVVTECAAICAYLADAFPEAGLAPPPAARGDYYRWLFFAAGPVEAAVAVRMLGVEPDEKQRATVGFGSMAAVLDTLEHAVRGKRYLAGGRFSAADVYVGSQIGWGLRFGTLEKRPALVAYWEGLSDREAYRRASAIDDEAAARLSA
ncbi:MAG TPA: glutathione S-transferase family protein [Nevskiales bacterium]|nr:glutathione S-transferase family protein [Nevskiales bacterium]